MDKCSLCGAPLAVGNEFHSIMVEGNEKPPIKRRYHPWCYYIKRLEGEIEALKAERNVWPEKPDKCPK